MKDAASVATRFSLSLFLALPALREVNEGMSYPEKRAQLRSLLAIRLGAFEGKDLAKKRAFEKFLADHGYRNAVVTIDDDYIYSGAYARADAATKKRIAQKGWFSTAGLPYKSRDHAWFASYAPADNPQMVLVVFVEHAGAHGGTAAAPLAKLMYESRFRQQVRMTTLGASNPAVNAAR